MLPLALDLVQSGLLALVVIIRGTEMMPMIFLFRVLITSPRKVESQPAINLELVADGLVAVVGIDLSDLTPLDLIGSGCFNVSRIQ